MDQILAANIERYDDGTEIDNYLEEPHHKRRTQRALALLNQANKMRGGKVSGIELASGSGQIAEKIKRMGYGIIACDASTGALQLAAKRGLQTRQFDASKEFPFATASQDYIYAGELIEHVFNTRAFLTECARVLKPGGVLVLTTPNLATLKDRLRFPFGGTPRQVNPLHSYLYLHIRPFTPQLLRDCLRATGFHSISIKSHLVGVPLPWGEYNSALLARLFPQIGRSLISVAQKA